MEICSRSPSTDSCDSSVEVKELIGSPAISTNPCSSRAELTCRPKAVKSVMKLLRKKPASLIRDPGVLASQNIPSGAINWIVINTAAVQPVWYVLRIDD